jgi:ABC-2 type transport system permease protein
VWIVAIRDILFGLSDYRLWMFLGWQDIRQRYRRSVLGPIWLTISTGVMVVMMSLLYGRIFKLPLDIYAPFLVSGTIVWNLISSLLNEGCTSLTEAQSLIKQVRLPLTVHICRVVWRNFIIFFHNAIILVILWFYFGKWIGIIEIVTIIIALLLFALNGLWVGIVLGAFCTRFRDIGQMVTNLIQVVYFITPIMWMPSVVEGKGIALWLILFNPFYHFIEIVRAPLLILPFPITSWLITLCVTLLGAMAGVITLGRFRNRIPYWL